LGEIDAALPLPFWRVSLAALSSRELVDLRVSWGDRLTCDSTLLPRTGVYLRSLLPRGIEFFLNRERMHGIWEGCLPEMIDF
jgi:hypothetical protein